MRSVLIWFVLVNGVSCGCNDKPTPPGKQYQREALQGGTFWIDRWGQGRLDTYEMFIDERNFPRLNGHQGNRIALYNTLSSQDQVPGTPAVIEFETVQRLPQPEREIRLRWLDKENRPVDAPLRRMRPGQEAAFEVQVTNWEPDEMILDTNELKLWLTSRHPPGTYYNGMSNSFGTLLNIKRKHGVLRYSSYSANLFPHDTVFAFLPDNAWGPQPQSDAPVIIKTGETFSWKVTISGWSPDEYEMMVTYHKYIPNENDSPVDRFQMLSSHLYLDVLTDQPRMDDLIDLHVRQRDETLLQPGQPVPLEIVLQNRTEKELIIYPGNSMMGFQEHVTWEQKVKLMKGTPDDLDLSDMLFCYGSDGRVLPLTSKVAGPMEIRVPVNGSFTLPVDAPPGTEVARAVFYNSSFAPKMKGESDPARYVHGWHWSEHWQHPTVREQVP